jgi:hypothetical protein
MWELSDALAIYFFYKYPWGDRTATSQFSLNNYSYLQGVIVHQCSVKVVMYISVMDMLKVFWKVHGTIWMSIPEPHGNEISLYSITPIFLEGGISSKSKISTQFDAQICMQYTASYRYRFIGVKVTLIGCLHKLTCLDIWCF